MRKFVIADIRGEITLFKKLLQKIGPTETDQLIFTGSYLGPGSDSKAVVDLILSMMKKLPKMVFLCGCYEFMFQRCIEHKPNFDTMRLWGSMGGMKVFESYAAKEKIMIVQPAYNNGNGKPKIVEAAMQMMIPETHIRFTHEGLGHWFEDDTYPYVVTHSGGHPVLYGGAIDNEQQLVFAERDWWEQDGRRIPGKTVIFSHYPFPKPFQRAGKIGLDLGAGMGGKLCSFEMFSESFTTVE